MGIQLELASGITDAYEGGDFDLLSQPEFVSLMTQYAQDLDKSIQISRNLAKPTRGPSFPCHKFVQMRDMSLGKRLDDLREKRGISVRELARRLGGVAPNTVTRWIEDDISPRLDEAMRLASFFDVSLNFLAYDDGRVDFRSSALTPDEEFVLQLFRDLGIGREEAVRRLAGEPGGKAREGGVGQTFAHRELSEIERAKKRSGLEPDPKHSQIAEGKNGGPGPGDR